MNFGDYQGSYSIYVGKGHNVIIEKVSFTITAGTACSLMIRTSQQGLDGQYLSL